MNSSNSLKINGVFNGSPKVQNLPTDIDSLLKQLSLSPEGKNYITRLKKEAFEKGFSEGVSQEQANQESNLKSVIEILESLASELKKEKDIYFEKIENILINVSLEAMEQLLCHELLSGTTNFKAMLDPILSKIRSHNEIEVECNPSDVKKIKELGVTFIENGNTKIEIKESKHQVQGGFVLKTSLGKWDFSIEKRWKSLKDIFLGEG